MYDPYDDDYPRIVRSTGVAPFWRALAILAMIAAVGAGFIALVLAIALINRPSTVSPAIAAKPAPVWGGGPQGINGPGAGGAGDDMEEDEKQGNLPFPIVRQVDPDTIPIPGEPPPAQGPGDTPRQRFLGMARDVVWKGNANDYSVTMISVSPDGRFMAVEDSQGLKAGFVGNPASMELVQEGAGPLPPGGMGGGMGGPAGGPMRGPAKRPWWVAGAPSWSNNGFMYFAASDGMMRQYDINQRELHVFLHCFGDVPTIDPKDGRTLVYVRSQPVAKTEAPGKPGISDPTEVVCGDINGPKPARVLVRASNRNWTRLALSPDGKRLALIANQPHEKGYYGGRNRVYVMDLDGGEPTPITPAVMQIGNIAWRADGQGLIYSRGHEALPADYWKEENPWIHQSLDLFHYDLQTMKETRLSRGGGFQCAGIDSQMVIYFRCDVNNAGSHYAQLLKVDLKAAEQFAAAEPEAVLRDVKAWTAVIDQTIREAGVEANAAKTKLTAEKMAKMSEAFGRVYRDQFKATAPANLRELDRQGWELNSLVIAGKDRRRFAMVRAAVEGEYLRTKHGAEWRLSEGPPTAPNKNVEEASNDNPFAFVLDLAGQGNIRVDDDEDEDDERPRYFGPLTQQVRQAAGRKLILTNDPSAGKAGAEALADSDLEKGADLLKQRKNADELLKGLVKKHPKNRFLALHVAKLLLDNQRRDAARAILLEEREPSVLDVQKHNLLGIAWLEDAPRTAIEEFQKALGCNPNYGPALLNLSQAYTAVRDYQKAEECLRYYVKRYPGDANAADARRRLADLHARRTGNP
jgi:tetratricopeptide (TPR) repeat protein